MAPRGRRAAPGFAARYPTRDAIVKALCPVSLLVWQTAVGPADACPRCDNGGGIEPTMRGMEKPRRSAVARERGMSDGGTRRGTGAIDHDVLERLVEAVVRTADPERVILFGSAARGELTDDSTSTSWSSRTSASRWSSRATSRSLCLRRCTRSTSSSFGRRTSKSTGTHRGGRFQARCAKAGRCMSSARKRRDTDDAHLWMREAWDKLVTAKEYSDRNPALNTRCALALDAAELAVKAVIIARNSSYRVRSSFRGQPFHVSVDLSWKPQVHDPGVGAVCRVAAGPDPPPNLNATMTFVTSHWWHFALPACPASLVPSLPHAGGLPQKQRVMFALALGGDPELVFLRRCRRWQSTGLEGIVLCLWWPVCGGRNGRSGRVRLRYREQWLRAESDRGVGASGGGGFRRRRTCGRNARDGFSGGTAGGGKAAVRP